MLIHKYVINRHSHDFNCMFTDIGLWVNISISLFYQIFAITYYDVKKIQNRFCTRIDLQRVIPIVPVSLRITNLRFRINMPDVIVIFINVFVYMFFLKLDIFKELSLYQQVFFNSRIIFVIYNFRIFFSNVLIS